MSNSKYVEYTRLSPNCSERTAPITKITIHHMAVVNGTLEGVGARFADRNSYASANYGIDSNGKVALYVPEDKRAWTSSNAENDNSAVTIEVANSAAGPDWPVSGKAYAKLIDLCVDICQRNGIKELVYNGTKYGTLTRHNMFTSTACPGPYLQARFPEIAEMVNRRLYADLEPTPTTGTLWRVQVGAYKVLANAIRTRDELKAKGYQTYLVQSGDLYKVQCGAFSVRSNAEALAAKLKAAGYSTYITTQAGKAADTTPKIVEGAKVKIKDRAKDYNGKSLASFVYDRVHTVAELDGDRAVLTYNGTVVCAMAVSNLIAVG